jgi:hypothetical protein
VRELQVHLRLGECGAHGTFPSLTGTPTGPIPSRIISNPGVVPPMLARYC